MQEISKRGSVKKIRKTIEVKRKRGANSVRILPHLKNKSSVLYDRDSHEWLSNNYIIQYGLRNWTWQVIIDGIIQANINCAGFDKVSKEHIKMMWITFLKIAGIENLQVLPVYKDPHHVHVKVALFMYSMESFLYPMLNRVSREKDTSAIKTIGPFAALLSRIISHA